MVRTPSSLSIQQNIYAWRFPLSFQVNHRCRGSPPWESPMKSWDTSQVMWWKVHRFGFKLHIGVRIMGFAVVTGIVSNCTIMMALVLYISHHNELSHMWDIFMHTNAYRGKYVDAYAHADKIPAINIMEEFNTCPCTNTLICTYAHVGMCTHVNVYCIFTYVNTRTSILTHVQIFASDSIVSTYVTCWNPTVCIIWIYIVIDAQVLEQKQ